MAQGIVAKAEQVLWEELLWVEDNGQRRSTDLAAIQDDVTVAQRGACFLSLAQLEEGRDWILARLASVPTAQQLYKSRVE